MAGGAALTEWRGRRFLHTAAPPLALALVAAAVRLPLLSDIDFSPDDATVATQVRHMLSSGQLAQTGMQSSTGPLNPPLFDYLMTPPLALSSDPRLAVLYVALLNVGAVVLTYMLARRAWGSGAAIVAAGLFALEPWSVVFSRSIWAPDLQPVLATVCLYAWLHLRQGDSAWWGMPALAVWLWMCQVQQSAVLLAPVVLLAAWVARLRLRLTPLLTGLVVGLAPLAPYVRYDALHHWINLQKYLIATGWTHAIDGTSLQLAVMDVTSVNTLQLDGVRYNHFTPLEGLLSLHSDVLTAFFALAMLVAISACAGSYLRHPDAKARLQADLLLVLLAWMWLPVVLTVLHDTTLYQHYYLMLFPAPFLLLGYAAARLAGWQRPSSGWLPLGQPTVTASRDLSSVSRDSQPSPVLAATWRSGSVVVALAIAALGWLTLEGSYYRHLASPAAVADFPLPLAKAEALAGLIRQAGQQGPLWIEQPDGGVRTILAYLLQTSPQALDAPADALALPPAGSAGGFVFASTTDPGAQLLRRAGLPALGMVPYLLPQQAAVAFRWPAAQDQASVLATFQPLNIPLADGVVFVGDDLQRLSPQQLRVAYVWRVTRGGPGVNDANLAVYTHVVDSSWHMWAQSDGMPLASATWRSGQVIVSWFDVPLNNVPPGNYMLRFGMYRRPSVERIPAVTAQGTVGANEFSLGTLTITR